MIARDLLVDMLCERSEPILLIEAVAGMGKSVLLRQLAQRLGADVTLGTSITSTDPTVLWDLEVRRDASEIDETFISGERRLIIARRPGCTIPGLSRANAYRAVFRLDPATLLLTPEELRQRLDARTARRVLKRSGGWPVLADRLMHEGMDEADLRAFLETCLLADMTPGALVGLGEFLRGLPILPGIRAALSPLVIDGPEGEAALVAPDLHVPLQAAQAFVLERRLSDEDDARLLADAYLSHGHPAEAITALQRAGQYGWALDIFAAEGGIYYIYRHGPNAYATILSGFPDDFIVQHEDLWTALCLQALKRGDVGRARRLLYDVLGSDALDHMQVFSNPGRYSLTVRHFRLLMLIYEDHPVNEALLESCYRILDEIPVEAHLQRGSFYNAMIEFYIRLRRFPEAEEVAARAGEHYRQAHVPLLEFYINLDRGLTRLMLGDASKARRFVNDAAENLARIAFPIRNDQRLLKLLDACIEYERGRVEPLARFLTSEFEEFSHGEIWPSLIDFALHYGSQALSEHFSMINARNFLDRWRVYQYHNEQFQTLIDIREATILQNGNRWQEAAEKLSGISAPINRAWVLSNAEGLVRLDARDDIAIALAWLRQLLFEAPDKPQLLPAILALRNNLHVTTRQRACLDIWLAYVHKRSRDLTRVRAILQKSFETAARLDAIAPLAEERFFLADLVDSQRVSEFLDASPSIRQIIRRLREIGLPEAALGVRTGLTRRETKIVLMIAEGASNKHVAHVLGLSEATVKFHLGNAYRKLGCSNRREAIGAARALGLVS